MREEVVVKNGVTRTKLYNKCKYERFKKSNLLGGECVYSFESGDNLRFYHYEWNFSNKKPKVKSHAWYSLKKKSCGYNFYRYVHGIKNSCRNISTHPGLRFYPKKGQDGFRHRINQVLKGFITRNKIPIMIDDKSYTKSILKICYPSVEIFEDSLSYISSIYTSHFRKAKSEKELFYRIGGRINNKLIQLAKDKVQSSSSEASLKFIFYTKNQLNSELLSELIIRKDIGNGRLLFNKIKPRETRNLVKKLLKKRLVLKDSFSIPISLRKILDKTKDKIVVYGNTWEEILEESSDKLRTFDVPDIIMDLTGYCAGDHIISVRDSYQESRDGLTFCKDYHLDDKETIGYALIIDVKNIQAEPTVVSWTKSTIGSTGASRPILYNFLEEKVGKHYGFN